MAKFRFQGFSTASAVALSVAQGAASDSGSVGSWGQAEGTGTVSITVDKPATAFAPAQVWVEATGHSGLASFEDSGVQYDGSFHEYYHVWTVNGQPLSAFQAPQNMVNGWNNPNVAYGQYAAFCFPDPGETTPADVAGPERSSWALRLAHGDRGGVWRLVARSLTVASIRRPMPRLWVWTQQPAAIGAVV